MNVALDPVLIEQVTETRYGPLHYYSVDGFVGRSLEVYGEYSPDETAFLSRLVRPGWKVINGGANIGALTIPLSEMVGSEGKVWAFEPQPEAFDLLLKNISDRDNIHASPLGLWDEKSESKIALYREMNHTNFGGVFVGMGSQKIQLTTIDEFLGEERVDLIFLDIEGAEVKALQGAAETIAKHRPLLYLEDHPAGAGAGSELSRYCRSLNYICYTHKPSLFSPNNFKGVKENYFTAARGLLKRGAEIVSFNLFCVPRERIEEYYDIVDKQAKFLKERSKSELQIVVPLAPALSKKWAAVCRFGGVGDDLIAASTFKPLKEEGFQVEILTQTPYSSVFENNPFVDKISAYAPNSLPTDFDKWQEWFRLRSQEYTRFGNLSHSVETRHALFPVQTWFWWPPEVRRKLCKGSYLETAHDIMGVPYNFGPLFFPTDEEREQARETRARLGARPIIGWCIGGTRIDKVYPYTPLVIARLIKELGCNVVMLCAPTARDLEIAKLTQESVKAQNGTDEGLSHAGSPSIEDQTWPVRRILTFAAQCDLYIGFDTGPSWGVAFEPLPKIILLSHASPENITKHWLNTVTLTADASRVSCWPCHRLHSTFETCTPLKVNDGDFAACISDINAETIVSSARQLLEEN